MGSPQPLYFYEGTKDFVTTTPGTSEFSIQSKEKIELFCSDGFRSPFAINNVSAVLTATCISGKQFLIANKTSGLQNAICHHHPNHTTVVTNRNCSVGKLIEIGFSVNGVWVPVLEVCHDDKIGSTKWVHHELKPNNANHQRSVPRIWFIKGDFYHGIHPEVLYLKVSQRKTLGKVLKSQKMADELIILENSDLYLARGHLAAKADYVFASHQLATFYYINVAPQWQSFNNGNWLAIEISVKKFIEKRNIDADIYTGTHDVVSYTDVNGTSQEFYLALNYTNQHRIPVPKYYYKIIIARSISAGIVFIGVNNPYATEEQIQKDHIICTDISDKVNYINWQRHNITAGYSYACSVDEFLRAVKSSPELPTIKKLLL